MKIFLLIIVLFCCFLIGFKIKKYFDIRKKFFEDLIFFCQNIKNKISYQNQKLGLVIADELSFNYSKTFLVFLKVFESFVNQNINKDDLKMFFESKLPFLKEDEKEAIYNFLLKTGSLFQEEELEQISNFEKWAKSHLSIIEEFNKKFSNLYFKLFIILGAMIFIIFI